MKDLSPRQIEALRVAVAEIAGVKPMFYLIKRSLYWRPNGAGYTDSKLLAGLYSEEAAKRLEDTSEPAFNDRVYIEPAEIPNYPADLNAVHEVEMMLTGRQWDAYTQELDRVSRRGDKLPWRDMNVSRVIDAYLVHASAADKCIALVMTCNPEKWEEIKGMEVGG